MDFQQMMLQLMAQTGQGGFYSPAELFDLAKVLDPKPNWEAKGNKIGYSTAQPYVQKVKTVDVPGIVAAPPIAAPAARKPRPKMASSAMPFDYYSMLKNGLFRMG